MNPSPSVLERDACPWQERMDFIVETMREMSLQVDPQEMVAAYGARMRQIMPADRFLSLSRRDLKHPRYRISRSSTWDARRQPLEGERPAPHFRRRPSGRIDLRR